MSGISAGDIAGPFERLEADLRRESHVRARLLGERHLAHNEAWLRGGSGTSNADWAASAASARPRRHAYGYNNCFYAGVCYGRLLGRELPARSQPSPRQDRNDPQLRGRWSTARRPGYCYWNTLMGDPAQRCGPAYPGNYRDGYPATVPIGANVVDRCRPRPGSVPVEGAWVYLRKGDQIHIGWDTTDISGVIDAAPIDASAPGTRGRRRHSAGTILATHTRAGFQIAEGGRLRRLFDYMIDDGTDLGNGDGQVQSG